MNRAKAFFYVSAGLFLLALSYHVGARNAHAQIGGQIQGGSFVWTGVGNGYRVSGVVGRTMYWLQDNGQLNVVQKLIPGTQPIAASSPLAIAVLLDDGEVLQFDGQSWALRNNLIPVQTNVEQHTLGQLKARFRDPAPAGQ